MVYTTELDSDTVSNTQFRKVLHTTDTMQLVLMSIDPGKDIGMEQHSKVTQFIRVETGSGVVVTLKTLTDTPSISLLKDGTAVIIPPGEWHNVINLSETEPLKLYTVYSPPEHH